MPDTHDLWMNTTDSTGIWRRVAARIDAWRIVVDRQVETEGSVVVFGQRGSQPVVLKVIRHHGDEWRSGDILNAFAGHGVVRVLDYLEGAVLLERLRPGQSLVRMAMDGNDDRATGILADIMGKMSPRAAAGTMPALREWGQAFERHAAGGDEQIRKPLLEAARHVYFRLCASQSAERLLHGDLHHYNVLLDSERGWLAIDPKGVVGEHEYEVGAALRNPYERPELFTEPSTIMRRVNRFARELDLNRERILAWAFAQAVLAAIWAIEDGHVVGPDHAWITLANNIRPMLRDGVDD
jgi:streptomycin 6-kinase